MTSRSKLLLLTAVAVLFFGFYASRAHETPALLLTIPAVVVLTVAFVRKELR